MLDRRAHKILKRFVTQSVNGVFDFKSAYIQAGDWPDTPNELKNRYLDNLRVSVSSVSCHRSVIIRLIAKVPDTWTISEYLTLEVARKILHGPANDGTGVEYTDNTRRDYAVILRVRFESLTCRTY